jgi:wobble nucleotide-excising tRNase
MLDKVDKERTLIKNAFLRIQEIEERISGAEDSIKNMDTTIKENAKCKKMLSQNIQKIQEMLTYMMSLCGTYSCKNSIGSCCWQSLNSSSALSLSLYAG